ncbi:hypothetical protein [Paraburkholderia bannensis]|uniref:hypothetical protein n=1 Tax=Paraburkholderia bannensis TaxID=765414 RepID=UPI002AB7C546|nr:hypothetical protein [Paraburkholderia bannensis]
MSGDVRKLFEKRLQETLRSNIDLKGVKIIRNEIVVNQRDGKIGRIGFRFLSNANAYILSASADSQKFQDFFKSMEPPYRPNIPTGLVFAMNTSMETEKLFSPNQGGAVTLPRDESEIEQACQWICKKVKEIYLPRVLRVLDNSPKLIGDVMANPDYYSYPMLTIVFSALNNEAGLDGFNIDYLLGGKRSNNKKYDSDLLRKFGGLI